MKQITFDVTLRLTAEVPDEATYRDAVSLVTGIKAKRREGMRVIGVEIIDLKEQQD